MMDRCYTESFEDPVRRLLAHNGMPQELLQYTNDPVSWIDQQSYSYPGSSDDSREGDVKPIILGEAELVVVEDETDSPFFLRLRGPFGTCRGHRRIMEVHGGEAVIIRSIARRQSKTPARRTFVRSIVVRPFADKQTVADWVKSLL